MPLSHRWRQQSTTKVKLLQLNLNHCAAAQDLLSQSVRETRTDVSILSEPYRTIESHDFALDISKKAAIWSCGDPAIQLKDKVSAVGFVRAKLGAIWVYSVYLAPSLTLAEFSSSIDALVADARGRHPVLIGGDFNARNGEA